MRIEIRTCIHCGETKEIEQKHKHATNICRECRNKQSNKFNTERALARGRRPGTTGRRPYPLEDGINLPTQKFRKIARKMIKMEEKEDWRKFMRENLDNTLANEELMSWIKGHDDDTPTKKIKKIHSDYPDTRYMTWEDYERGLGENEVDS